MADPTAVYDDYPINEYWWDWLDEHPVEEGDRLRVVTETHEWKTPFTVTDASVASDYIEMESDRGTSYLLLTYSSVHPLESPQPMVRTQDGYESRGVLKRAELFKDAD